MDEPITSNDEMKDQEAKDGKQKGQERKRETRKQTRLTIGCWNIKRGLVMREEELKELLHKEKIDIMFLLKMDTVMMKGEEDYTIKGYKIILTKLKETGHKIKIVGLVRNTETARTKTRTYLMSGDFPSIWLEVEKINKGNIIIGGFHREWTRNKDTPKESQMNNLQWGMQAFV